MNTKTGVSIKTDRKSTDHEYRLPPDYMTRKEHDENLPQGFSGSWNDLKDRPIHMTKAPYENKISETFENVLKTANFTIPFDRNGLSDGDEITIRIGLTGSQILSGYKLTGVDEVTLSGILESFTDGSVLALDVLDICPTLITFSLNSSGTIEDNYYYKISSVYFYDTYMKVFLRKSLPNTMGSLSSFTSFLEIYKTDYKDAILYFDAVELYENENGLVMRPVAMFNIEGNTTFVDYDELDDVLNDIVSS